MPSSTRWRLNISQYNYAGGGQYVGIHEVEMASVAAGADLCTGGTASTSESAGAPYVASKAFDNDLTTRWQTNGSALPQWLEYTFASAVSIVEYRISAGVDVPDVLPKGWTFEYYDGTTWNVVDTRVEQTGWTTNSTRTFSTVPTAPLVASVIAMPAFNGGTSAAIDTTGAKLLVLSACSANDPTGVSDSKGNTWSALTQRNAGSGDAKQRFYYVLNPTVGTGHTFTLSGSGIFCSFIVQAYSGAWTFQAENGAAATTGTSHATGSVTPTINGSLVVSALSLGGTPQTTITVDSGLAVTRTIPTTNATHGGMGHLVQTTAAAINPTWSWTTSSGHAVAVAVFTPVAATLARVQATGKVTADAASTVALTFASPPTVGNAVVVLVTAYKGAGPVLTSCADNRGNSYAQATSLISGQAACGIYYAPVVTGTGTPFTITVTGGASTYWVASAIEVSGIGAGLAVDKTVTNSSTSTALTTGSTAALTASEVFLAAVNSCGATLTSSTVGVTSPTWTEEHEELNWALHAAGEADSRIVTSATGTTPSCTWTVAPSQAYLAALAAFKASATALPARVNIATVSDWSGTTGATLATAAQSHTAGNTLIVCTGTGNSGFAVTGIADTAGNTYTKVDHAIPTDNSYREEIWYAKNITGHASNVVTVTWATAVTFRAVTVLQYSGLSPSTPFDATAKSSSNTNPVTTGTLTTTASNEIHILLTRWGWGTAIVWPAGLTIIPGLGANVEIAEALVAASMSGTYAINHAGAGSRLAFAAAFQPAAVTEGRVSQAIVETLSLPVPAARVTQAIVETLGTSVSVASPGRVTQAVVELLTQIPPPTPTRVSQSLVELLTESSAQNRVTLVAVELFTPLIAPSRVTQQAVEYFQGRAAALRASHVVVEIFRPPLLPTPCPVDFPLDADSTGECLTDFPIDPDVVPY